MPWKNLILFCLPNIILDFCGKMTQILISLKKIKNFELTDETFHIRVHCTMYSCTRMYSTETCASVVFHEMYMYLCIICLSVTVSEEKSIRQDSVYLVCGQNSELLSYSGAKKVTEKSLQLLYTHAVSVFYWDSILFALKASEIVLLWVQSCLFSQNCAFYTQFMFIFCNVFQ